MKLLKIIAEIKQIGSINPKLNEEWKIFKPMYEGLKLYGLLTNEICDEIYFYPPGKDSEFTNLNLFSGIYDYGGGEEAESINITPELISIIVDNWIKENDLDDLECSPEEAKKIMWFRTIRLKYELP